MATTAAAAGTIAIGGDMKVARMGYGAMRLTGQPGNWGPYPDPEGARAVLRRVVELGVTWVWMGFESARSGYRKLRDADTIAVTRELQAHGIRVQGSTIVGMEHHTPQNMRAEIEHAVAHDAACHQFMLYTPLPGTPLYAQMKAEGRMLEGVDLAEFLLYDGKLTPAISAAGAQSPIGAVAADGNGHRQSPQKATASDAATARSAPS